MKQERDTKHTAGSDTVRHVVCIQGGGTTSINANGKGWNMDVCFTLNALDVHGVAYEIHEHREPSE